MRIPEFRVTLLSKLFSSYCNNPYLKCPSLKSKGLLTKLYSYFQLFWILTPLITISPVSLPLLSFLILYALLYFNHIIQYMLIKDSIYWYISRISFRYICWLCSPLFHISYHFFIFLRLFLKTTLHDYIVNKIKIPNVCHFFYLTSEVLGVHK